MSKRLFRSQRAPEKEPASYPTLDEFDQGRRDFLTRLGATVLGAGSLAAALSGCGERQLVGELKPDTHKHQHDGGVAPQPDMEPPSPGGAPAPDARVDGHMDGDPAQPDSRIDHYEDGGHMGGAPRPPDAQIDQPQATPGKAPAPDAKTDKPAPSPGFAPHPDAGVK